MPTKRQSENNRGREEKRNRSWCELEKKERKKERKKAANGVKLALLAWGAWHSYAKRKQRTAAEVALSRQLALGKLGLFFRAPHTYC